MKWLYDKQMQVVWGEYEGRVRTIPVELFGDRATIRDSYQNKRLSNDNNV